MAEIFRDEWGADALVQSEVLEETRRIFRKAIDKGTPRQTPHRKAFKERLTASTDVFSAFRVHTQAQHMAELLTDENGRRLPFKEWAEKVQPYVNHQNRAWLRTEYDTATRRAHDEADWQRFQEDRDIYPNLEWVRTTSANPGKDHQPFWGTVLPIGDEFWTEHRPGDRWNCKCSLRQTDREPTETPRVSGQEYAPAPGLSAKPGSGEVFSEDHVYYPEDCRICPFAEKAGRLRLLIANLSGKKRRTLATSCMDCPYRKACMEEGKKEKRRAEYDSADETKWRKDGFYENGGYVLTSKERLAQADKSKNERAKFDKEHEMCEQAAKNGHAVKHMPDVKDGGSYDAMIDGKKTDLKRTKGSGNIQKFAKHAVDEQGAEQVFFQFDEFTHKHQDLLNNLARKGIHGLYFVTGKEYEIRTF